MASNLATTKMDNPQVSSAPPDLSVLGGELWLSGHGDLLTAEEIAAIHCLYLHSA